MTEELPVFHDPDEPDGVGGAAGDRGRNGEPPAERARRWKDGQHLGWRISALLDGELATTEEIVAREHLAGCDLCQEEFAGTMATRNFVRGLGEVEPPAGFLDRLVNEPRRPSPARLGAIGVVTLAAIWAIMLVVAAVITIPSVSPDVEDLADRHVAASADPRAYGERDGLERIDRDGSVELVAPFVLPDLVDLDVEAVFEGENVVQVLYSGAESDVSLFQEEGSLDLGSLPPGETLEVAGEKGWLAEVDGLEVLVTSRGSLVYTLVGEGGLEGLAEQLPEPGSRSVTDRVRYTVERMLGWVGLGD